MCKNVKVFYLFGQTLHSKGPFNIAFNSPIQPLVEVNTGSAVDDYVAGVRYQLKIFGRESYVLLL